MAARDKKELINLLPQEEFESSTFGRILKWAMSTFRIIVIFTELVVMFAFLSRFWLDARITDLNDEIKQNQSIIGSFSVFEKNFREAQLKLKIFTALADDKRNVLPTVGEISSLMPPDISLQSFTATGKDIRIKAASFTEQSIGQFIINLENVDKFQDITLLQAETDSDTQTIVFTITAKLGGG